MKKRRNRMFKKIGAISTAIMMMITLGTSEIMAAITKDSTGTITVDSVENGVEVSAYKIIDVNVENGAPVEPVFTWTDDVASWINTNFPTYINTGNKNEVTQAFQTLTSNSDAAVAFYEKIASAIKRNQFSIAPSKINKQTAGSTGKVTFTTMPMGTYLLTAKGGVKVYSPTTANISPEAKSGNWEVKNATISMKGTEPTIEKEVKNPSDGTVSIGDKVSYQLHALVPDFPQDASSVIFIVGDKLSEGLTIDKSTIKVYKDSNGSLGSLVSNSNYTLTYDGKSTSNTPYTFQISFGTSFINTNVGEKIHVTYDATVNQKALTIDSLKNKAYLGYNTDPYDSNSYKEKPTDKQVFTYGIGIIKVDKDTSTSLTGAEFSLSKDTTTLKFTKDVSGVYVLDMAGGTSILAVNNVGELYVQGIDEGTYVLKETKAPTGGYILPSGNITITIEEKDAIKDGLLSNGDVSVSTTGSTEIDNTLSLVDNKVVIKIKNNKGGTFDLPVTGGTGTIMFTMGGLVLMAGACVLFLKNRNAKQHH